ncbi:hypothetical protein PENARI_c014G09435 [Penicillium arizonense]|uniref:Uncharacterized protein n=1 Tax=Penicillium arizonense TaxID=1835702 RepID=A0A1F5LDN3_PENAI|nr:hypothetical protein PENARI_c014G09435 [Penicillium arizonense]OGE51120.1 hypothetical protein PENARI_c014G09435 [Penicillium arizonense]
MAAKVDPTLSALYEVGAAKSDSSGHVQNLGLSREALYGVECETLNAALPRLDERLSDLDIDPYCTAPILSPDKWSGIMNAVPTFEGNASHADVVHGGNKPAKL